MTSDHSTEDDRRTMTVEFVSRRRVESAYRLTVMDEAGDLLPLLAEPQAPCTLGLRTADRYQVQNLRWCESTSGLDRPITDAVDELELRPPFGLIDEETAIRRASDQPSDAVGDLLALLEVADQTAQREALSELATVVDRDPASGLDAVPILAAKLESGEIPPAPTLACLAPLAEAHPCQVTPAVSAVTAHMETSETVSEDALSMVTSIAAHHPTAVRDAVPTLVPLLEDGVQTMPILRALVQIAKVAPEAVLPACDTLTDLIEWDGAPQLLSLAALGYVAKQFPVVAAESVGTAMDLLEAEDNRLRANAAGLLADVADGAPGDVRPAVPRAIDLLEDEDKYARYNATSILSRVAKQHPEAVEAATGPLIDSLKDDFARTRSNACWALGHLGATEALSALQLLESNDPDEEVRSAAEWAIYHLSEDSDEPLP